MAADGFELKKKLPDSTNCSTENQKKSPATSYHLIFTISNFPLLKILQYDVANWKERSSNPISNITKNHYILL